MDRVDALDWDALRAQLDDAGHAITPRLLDADECDALEALFDGGRFPSTIDMARHRFGDGRYRYFDYPLPDPVPALRERFYAHLAPIANDWSQRLRGGNGTFPLDHAALLEQCRAAGQARPTPLILRYGEGDWNALHQDLYGDVYFPFQVLTVLDNGFTGGEFVLLEQRPRAQSRGESIATEQGEIVIFATRHRPVQSTRGWYRAAMRHGVSRIVRGSRYTLGVIFHDAA